MFDVRIILEGEDTSFEGEFDDIEAEDMLDNITQSELSGYFGKLLNLKALGYFIQAFNFEV